MTNTTGARVDAYFKGTHFSQPGVVRWLFGKEEGRDFKRIPECLKKISKQKWKQKRREIGNFQMICRKLQIRFGDKTY